MKLEQLPSGSYRIRKMISGKQHTLTFDHKPSQKEITVALADVVQNADYDRKDSFEHYADEYVQNRSAVLSPSSIRTYRQLIRNLSDNFKQKKLRDITRNDVQIEINRYATTHAPKTVRSLHGFISAIFADFRPSFTLHTTLPQKEVKSRYLPTEDDIKRILEASKGSEYSVAFQLGILSCRRSEIAALDLSDLDGNRITISKNMVYNETWEIKATPKTDASYRTITIPDSLKEEILSQGYIYKRSPAKLNEALHRYQKKLSIPQFRFHDLRHYFASYASTMISEADAMALGGWKSDYVFKQIYRESMTKSRNQTAQKIAKNIIPSRQNS